MDTFDSVPLFLLICALTVLWVELSWEHRQPRGRWRWLGVGVLWSLVFACALWVFSVSSGSPLGA